LHTISLGTDGGSITFLEGNKYNYYSQRSLFKNFLKARPRHGGFHLKLISQSLHLLLEMAPAPVRCMVHSAPLPHGKQAAYGYKLGI